LYKKWLLLIIITFLVTAAVGGISATEAASQLSTYSTNAQGEHTTTLIHGIISAATSHKPFGGEAIGAYSIVLAGQKVSINLHLHKLPESRNIFEAQLVDTNTNSIISLGQVDAKNITISVSQNIMSIFSYDQIIIVTRQPAATAANTSDSKYSQPIGGAALQAPFGNDFIF
jgi:hypothetical protein